MKVFLACMVGIVVLQGAAPAEWQDASLGISVSDGRQAEYYLAISEHFHVPPLHVVELHDRYRCADEELPVVYALAAHAHVAPATIVSLRVRHRSWLDITFDLGLTPEVFFVPVPADPVGPPYGNAYGSFRKYGATREWKRIALTDQDVVALVNLRFLSEYHGAAPEVVMAMRGREASFVAINDEFKRGSAAHGPQQDKGNGKKR